MRQSALTPTRSDHIALYRHLDFHEVRRNAAADGYAEQLRGPGRSAGGCGAHRVLTGIVGRHGSAPDKAGEEHPCGAGWPVCAADVVAAVLGPPQHQHASAAGKAALANHCAETVPTAATATATATVPATAAAASTATATAAAAAAAAAASTAACWFTKVLLHCRQHVV